MKEKIYKIFDLSVDYSTGRFCGLTFFFALLISAILGTIFDDKMFIIGALLLIPTLFFITWFILALIVLGIEKLIIAPIEFVVYELGIPKIKINVDVIWKYQQKN